METPTIVITEERKKQLLTEISGTFRGLENALSAFSQTQFNVVPFEGSWTPGQVAEHLIKAVSGLPDSHTEVTQREYDEKVAPIEEMFLNFSIKMKSPDGILPGCMPQDKEEVLDVFRRKQVRLETTVNTKDLTLTCLDFEFPTQGTLTRYEWIRFFLCHIQRHTWQLGNIFAVMEEKGIA